MRPIAALLAILLFAIVPTLAHADSFYDYAGSLTINGSAYENYYGVESLHTYNNELVPASLTIHKVESPYSAYYLVDGFSIDLPNAEAEFSGLFADHFSCPYEGDCLEIFYQDNYNPYANGGPDPLAGVLADGNYSYSYCTDAGYACYSGSVEFDGDLSLVTAATPEPTTFALLGTGLLGLAGALKRRSA